MSTANEKTVMDKDEISQALKRIAKEIVLANKEIKNVVLIGILNRGLPLANRLSKLIEGTEKVKVPVGALDVSLHRDDFREKGREIEVKRSDIPFSMDGKVVILVDDVIYAGRTIRAAMDGLADYGRASKIQLVALIDRGLRELPINPDYVGKKISTAADESVIVHLAEMDGVDKAVIK
ncbi:MAG: bifunctional pyr operon transcriptional regulator/uracil phosphoribosyltransferase PyrR [bacterium]